MLVASKERKRKDNDNKKPRMEIIFQYEFVRMNGHGSIIERVPLDLQSNFFPIQALSCLMAFNQWGFYECGVWIQNGWSALTGRRV